MKVHKLFAVLFVGLLASVFSGLWYKWWCLYEAGIGHKSILGLSFTGSMASIIVSVALIILVFGEKK